MTNILINNNYIVFYQEIQKLGMAKILEIFTLKTFVNQYDNDHTGLLAVSWIQPLKKINPNKLYTRLCSSTQFMKDGIE